MFQTVTDTFLKVTLQMFSLKRLKMTKKYIGHKIDLYSVAFCFLHKYFLKYAELLNLLAGYVKCSKRSRQEKAV